MHIGVIHTVGSPCRCAEAISAGLTTLGHKVLIANSEDIVLMAPHLAGVCDLIIDHSDTFLGRGYLRFTVRSILEAHGVRVVGTGSKACQIADNKVTSKILLGKTGIPVPPGIVVTSDAWNLPSWLQPPFVVKTAYEHMSRGSRLVHTGKEAGKIAADLLEQAHQPVIIETYIPGKELAVSVIDDHNGLRMLTPLEWYSTSNDVFLAENLKLVEPSGKTRPEASRPELSASAMHELEGFAHLAFRTLDLKDYARFDIRLTEGGTFFFLETNVTPSLEPLEAFAISAGWEGLSYAELIERMLASAIRRYGDQPFQPRKNPIFLCRQEEDKVQGGNHSLRLPNSRESACSEGPGVGEIRLEAESKVLKEKSVRIEMPAGIIEIEAPVGVHPPFPSSVELTKLLDINPGERVLDLGCGSGILSVTAAKLGAGEVVAVDLDPLSLETTISNAQQNGVEGLIKVYAGTWFEALREKPLSSVKNNLFDVIIATPPQTPAPAPFSPRCGGPDGTLHLFKIIDNAADFLEPDRGRLWLLAITLANPSAVLNRLKKHFQEVSIVQESERSFTADEYNTMNEGLMEYLLALRVSEKSDFIEKDNKTYIFRNLFIRAARPL